MRYGGAATISRVILWLTAALSAPKAAWAFCQVNDSCTPNDTFCTPSGACIELHGSLAYAGVCEADDDCDDLDPCNGIEVCAGTPNQCPECSQHVDCIDADPCTRDECDRKGICHNVPLLNCKKDPDHQDNRESGCQAAGGGFSALVVFALLRMLEP